jgi:hypothetical protein
MGPCVRRDDSYSTSVNLQQQRALDHRKLSSETMVSTVSPSGVTWFGDSSNPALRSKEVQQLHLSNPTAVKTIGN